LVQTGRSVDAASRGNVDILGLRLGPCCHDVEEVPLGLEVQGPASKEGRRGTKRQLWALRSEGTSDHEDKRQ
jgi:hypothetical protein